MTLNRFARVLWSTLGRTFYLYPVLVIGFETLRRGYFDVPMPFFLLLLPWGYLQFRLTRSYQRQKRSGSGGLGVIPNRLLQGGPYAFTRNPMYLGHLIFMLGLALSFWSWLGGAIFLVNIVWFHRRVLKDEALLCEKFGDGYDSYCQRVRRWVPILL